MADVSKCSGTNCPLKETCYRFTAPNSELWQSWMTSVPIKDGKCEMYIDNKLWKKINQY